MSRCDICKTDLRLLSTLLLRSQRTSVTICVWHNKWNRDPETSFEGNQENKQHKTQTLFPDTPTHPHLPSRLSVGLCCMILSMHFSCSRLIMQCSDSETTWKRGIEVQCHIKGYTRRQPLTQIRKKKTNNFSLQIRNKKFCAPLLPLFHPSRDSDDKIVKLWQDGVERPIFLCFGACEVFSRTNQNSANLITFCGSS